MGSIASTTRKFAVLERKHKGALSLNLQMLANCVDELKIILILKNEMLLLILFCNRVVKQREDTSTYGKTINNSFLGTVCCTIFGANCLLRKYFNALIN